jgi:hypothetical protein
MGYYVAYDPNGGTLYGISSYEDVNVPPQYVREWREGDFPCDISNWSTDTRDFMKTYRVISKLDFLTRFTMQERLTIRTFQDTDSIIDDFMKILEISQEIDLGNPLTKQGLMYLVSVGAIQLSRVDEILGG